MKRRIRKSTKRARAKVNRTARYRAKLRHKDRRRKQRAAA